MKDYPPPRAVVREFEERLDRDSRRALRDLLYAFSRGSRCFITTDLFAQRKETTMTLRQAKLELKPLQISITKRDGEYRVNYLGGIEATAYYTNNLDDALHTGRAMAFERVS